MRSIRKNIQPSIDLIQPNVALAPQPARASNLENLESPLLSWFGIRSSVGILAILLICSLPLFFLRGFGVFDDSLFLKFGELIASGGIPYRDFFDNKPPGTYLIGAGIAWLGQGHWLAPRFFLVVFALFYGWGIIRFCRSVYREQVAYYATIFFLPSYVIAQGYSFHTDQLAAIWGLAAAWALLRLRSTPVKFLVAGISVGVSFWFKQVAVLYLVANLVWVALQAGREGLSIRKWLVTFLHRSGWMVLGFLIPLAVMAIGLKLFQAGPAALDAIFREGFLAAKSPLNLTNTLTFWRRFPAAIMAILGLGWLAFRLKFSPWLNWLLSPTVSLLGLNAIFAAIPTLRMTHDGGHLAQTSLWALAALTGVILDRAIGGWDKDRSGKLKAWGTVLGYLGFFSYLGAMLYTGAYFLQQRRLILDLDQMNEIRSDLAHFIPAQEPILCISESAARLYYMSGHPAASRFLFFWWPERFNLSDALALLKTHQVAAALVEFPKGRPISFAEKEMKVSDLAVFESSYRSIPLRTAFHPIQNTTLYLLIRRDYTQRATAEENSRR